MTSLLVTGGAGYVGAHTVRHLIATGASPASIVVFDSLERGHRDFVPAGVELVVGDLRSPADLEAVFARRRFDAVLHFAAFISVGESVAAPALYHRNNVEGGLNLLEAARRHGCGALVHSSSAAVYGAPSSLPVTEASPLAPQSPYGEGKRALEAALARYARDHGIRSACLRYFNAAGAGYGIGERHEPETHLIPLALQVALGRHPHFTLYGDDYPTPDGTCLRDYVHVLDLAEAHARALAGLESGAITHDCINVGAGSAASVREVLALAREVTRREIPVVVAPRRPGDPPVLLADTRRARERLGWEARRGLREILEDAWRWHQRSVA